MPMPEYDCEIYTQDNCGWCVRAISLLEDRGWKPVVHNLSRNSYAKAWLKEAYPSVKTVPQIFIYGKHIGGYEDLLRYLEDTSGGYGDGQL